MSSRYVLFFARIHGHWRGAAAVVILITAALLLMSSLTRTDGSGGRSSILLLSILTALAASIALLASSFVLLRRQQRETASALDVSEQEYKSVFESTLDGILILNDRGICLDGNSAACRILGMEPGAVVGCRISEFLGRRDPERPGFLDHPRECGETSMVRADGRTGFVEYSAQPDFLPGRHMIVIRDVTRRRQAEAALRESEERFQQMASHIREVFWMLDARDRKALYVSPAYETITGRSCQSLREKPTSYEDVIHPEDRVRILARLREESVRGGHFDEEFRIVRPDAAVRWVWAHGFPVRDASGNVRYMVGTVQDVTTRKLAEQQIARNLDVAEAARAEAEAFRRISLALTENLSMDDVLDTLLQSLLDLVPGELAQIVLVEADSRLFLAREVQNCGPGQSLPSSPATMDAARSKFLMEVLATGRGILISDTSVDASWAGFDGFSYLRSWVCAPVLATGQVVGLLSVGDTRKNKLTVEHLRLAQSLAIPAAVAIQNARLYEQAEIFRAELEQRLADLRPSGGASAPSPV